VQWSGRALDQLPDDEPPACHCEGGNRQDERDERDSSRTSSAPASPDADDRESKGESCGHPKDLNAYKRNDRDDDGEDPHGNPDRSAVSVRSRAFMGRSCQEAGRDAVVNGEGTRRG